MIKRFISGLMKEKGKLMVLAALRPTHEGPVVFYCLQNEWFGDVREHFLNIKFPPQPCVPFVNGG